MNKCAPAYSAEIARLTAELDKLSTTGYCFPCLTTTMLVVAVVSAWAC